LNVFDMTATSTISTTFPYTTLFRSAAGMDRRSGDDVRLLRTGLHHGHRRAAQGEPQAERRPDRRAAKHLPLRRLSADQESDRAGDRKSTRLNSSHDQISYAVFCLKK